MIVFVRSRDTFVLLANYLYRNKPVISELQVTPCPIFPCLSDVASVTPETFVPDEVYPDVTRLRARWRFLIIPTGLQLDEVKCHENINTEGSEYLAPRNSSKYLKMIVTSQSEILPAALGYL
jgi:hypothetical protein